MAVQNKKVRLKKEIGLFGVYAIATGATLSAGFFLLPGLAAAEAGPAIVLAYIVAAIPLIPATFSIVELATAMPRAGGVYYFLDRSLGPWMGTMGGIGTWLALVLKVAFALVGMGAYIALYVPDPAHVCESQRPYEHPFVVVCPIPFAQDTTIYTPPQSPMVAQSP